jgi:hypothetical protein
MLSLLLLAVFTVSAFILQDFIFALRNNGFRYRLGYRLLRFRHSLARRFSVFADRCWTELRWLGTRLASEAGTYYTWMQGLGITNLTTTFTHSLGFNGTNLVARILMKGNVGATQTAGLQVVGVSTNTITVAPMLASTLITFDLEVQLIHSLIS